MKFGFYPRYAILSIALLAIEILIALFIRDRVVRPIVGDMLVVILIFTVCRSFIKADTFRLALAVLIFAFAVEAAQYFNLVSRLGLQQNVWARTVIGTTFDIYDLLAYCAGILIIVVAGLLAKYRDRSK